MPLLGNVRPHRGQIVLARNQSDVRAGQAVVEGAARSLAGASTHLNPGSRGISAWIGLTERQTQSCGAPAAVGIVVPLPGIGCVRLMLLAPDVSG